MSYVSLQPKLVEDTELAVVADRGSPQLALLGELQASELESMPEQDSKSESADSVTPIA